MPIPNIGDPCPNYPLLRLEAINAEREGSDEWRLWLAYGIGPRVTIYLRTSDFEFRIWKEGRHIREGYCTECRLDNVSHANYCKSCGLPMAGKLTIDQCEAQRNWIAT
jgi:hypothetical protein